MKSHPDRASSSECEILELVHGLDHDCDIVVISDYAKGFLIAFAGAGRSLPAPTRRVARSSLTHALRIGNATAAATT